MSTENTVGVVVGNTNTDSYSFILTSMSGSKGDLVYTESEIPQESSSVNFNQPIIVKKQ